MTDNDDTRPGEAPVVHEPQRVTTDPDDDTETERDHGRVLVTSPEPDFSGESAGVMFHKGEAIVDLNARANRKAVHYFRQAGYGVRDLDAADPDVPPAPEATPTTAGGDLRPGEQQVTDPQQALPKLSAPKSDWEAAGRRLGLTQSEVTNMTKSDLVAMVQELNTNTARPAGIAGETREGGQA